MSATYTGSQELQEVQFGWSLVKLRSQRSTVGLFGKYSIPGGQRKLRVPCISFTQEEFYTETSSCTTYFSYLSTQRSSSESVLIPSPSLLHRQETSNPVKSLIVRPPLELLQIRLPHLKSIQLVLQSKSMKLITSLWVPPNTWLLVRCMCLVNCGIAD